MSHDRISDVVDNIAKTGRRVTHVSNLQIFVHLSECLIGLGEEVVDDRFGELALFLVIVHFEDLRIRKKAWSETGQLGMGTDH